MGTREVCNLLLNHSVMIVFLAIRGQYISVINHKSHKSMEEQSKIHIFFLRFSAVVLDHISFEKARPIFSFILHVCLAT